MEFTRIRVQNFLSYEDATFELANRGLVLLQGRKIGSSAFTSNGAGKSSLVPEALLYALFNRTLRYGTKVTKVVRRAVGKDCLVTLEGRTADGLSVVIQRPQKHRTLDHPIITIGETEHHGADAVQEKVTELLGGVTWESFTSALVFAKKFFTGMTDAERKRVLEELLELGQINAFAKVAKAELAELDRQLAAAREDCRVIEGRLTALGRGITALEAEAAGFESRRVQDLATTEQALAAHRQAATDAERKLEALRPKLSTAEAAVRSLGAADERSRQVLAGIEAELRRQQEGRLLRDAARESLEGEARRMSALGPTCQSCRQTVPPEHREQVLADLAGRLDAERQAVRGFDEKVTELRTARKLVEEGYAREVTRPRAEHVAAIERLRVDISTTEFQLRTTRDTIQGVERSLASIRERKNTAAERLVVERAEESRLVVEAKDLLAKLTMLEEERPYREFWVSGFGQTGMKNQLMDGVIPRLNGHTSQLSDDFTDGLIKVYFTNQAETMKGEVREKFDIIVETPEGATDYDGCSTGEARRVDVVATLALGGLAASRIGQKLNLVVVDEIFDGLDSAGIERAVRLLMALAADRASVFVVTHREDLASYFPEVVTIEWERGVSRIVEAA